MISEDFIYLLKKKLGFTSKQVENKMYILEKIRNYTEKELDDVIDFYMKKFSIGKYDICRMIQNCPFLLGLKPETIILKTERYQSYFKLSDRQFS